MKLMLRDRSGGERANPLLHIPTVHHQCLEIRCILRFSKLLTRTGILSNETPTRLAFGLLRAWSLVFSELATLQHYYYLVRLLLSESYEHTIPRQEESTQSCLTSIPRSRYNIITCTKNFRRNTHMILISKLVYWQTNWPRQSAFPWAQKRKKKVPSSPFQTSSIVHQT